MKRSDISDLAALLAAHRGGYDNAIGPLEPIHEMNLQNVWDRLHDQIGAYPFKVGLRKMEQLDDRQWIEYGTSLNYAWRTPEGNDVLRRLLAEDDHMNRMRYGACWRCGGTLRVWVERDGDRVVEMGIGCPVCAGTSE